MSWFEDQLKKLEERKLQAKTEEDRRIKERNHRRLQNYDSTNRFAREHFAGVENHIERFCYFVVEAGDTSVITLTVKGNPIAQLFFSQEQTRDGKCGSVNTINYKKEWTRLDGKNMETVGKYILCEAELGEFLLTFVES